ncbi:hypothetical protein MBLNU457_7030t1 [Dothideomycetes sp. NU457]
MDSTNEKQPLNAPDVTENGAQQTQQPTHDPEKQQESKKQDKSDDNKEQKQPAGGYDATQLPRLEPGWTLKITFHRAENLPMADLNTMSSDPYIIAQIDSSVPHRHKEDPPLRLRTPTIRKNTEPQWNTEWIVGNIPSDGCKIKARIYDEDPADHDDRLGNVHISISNINENWSGIQNQRYSIKKRSGSKRAYLIRAVSACFNKTKHMSGNLYVSVELLGRTKDDNGGGRMYTIGPCWWTRHYSPMLGRLTNMKDPDDDSDNNNGPSKMPDKENQKSNAQRYNFQANQMQLQGPVPPELYHRFVEFKPFVKGMFTAKGLRGFVLAKALHHQHARVYNFDRDTVWGRFPQGPCKEMTRQFLDLVHHDQGGRIFTYVLTLDSLFRFTETGKEFGVDMLSKHTMHSDVSIYIAFSGEFFIRRLKHPNRPPPPEPMEETSQAHPDTSTDSNGNPQQNESHPPGLFSDGPPDEDPPKDPSHYELIIDNDSGTYRPNAKMLPLLKKYLAQSFPGLHIQVLDCQADAERMDKMKKEQRERKKAEGNNMVFTQRRSDSVSSSDEEELDALEGTRTGTKAGHSGPGLPGPAFLGAIKNDAAARGKGRVEHLKHNNPWHDRAGGRDGEEEEEGSAGQA